jgi:Flp pilus assembly secretin CpaC
MLLTPTVNEEATTVDVAVVNTNLVGFKSDGSVRLSRSEFSTQVSVGNKGEKFVIGGINKQQVLRSENGLPWLNSIPVLGWAFSSERESFKSTQLVAVLECVPVSPDTSVPAGIMSAISADKTKIDNYGVKCGVVDENDYGFDQFPARRRQEVLDPCLMN